MWPVGQIARMPVEERDGRLHGPGVLDMKAGLAIGIIGGPVRRGGRRAERRPTRALLATTRRGGRQRDVAGGDRASRARESAAVLVLEPALAGRRA